MNKKILYSLVGLVMIGVAIWGLTANKEKEDTAHKQELREEMEVSLTPEQKAATEKLVEDTLGKIEATKTQDIPVSEVFQLHLDLGLYYYSLGKLKLAKEAYLEAADIAGPNNPGPWAALFSVYRDMYDYENAEKAARKVVSLNPRDWNMWRSYIDLKQYQLHASRADLDKLYKEALDATKSDINIVTVYAQFLEQGGDLQSALNYWKIALAQQPNNEVYKAEVARLENELKNR